MPARRESEGLVTSGSHASYGALHRCPSYPNGSLPSLTDEKRYPDTERRWKFTWRQWLVFINFNIVNFCSAMCISLQAPFYPAEAERKGATPSQYGFVFGIFELVVFMVSPFYGKYMRVIGPKFMMNAGIYVTAICCILFGFLDKSPPGATFLALSFIVRIVAALGEAGYITASNTIIVREFPESIGTTFAFMKTSFGLGLIAGPTIGGALYEVGGYTLPFATLGGSMFVAACITVVLLPDQDNDLDGTCETNSAGMLEALKIPSVIIAGFAVTSTSISIGFTAAVLEPHLRQFHLPPTLMGLMFIVSGAVYALTSPIWGRICDIFGRAKLLCGLAAICMCISFLFVGPAPFLPFDTQLWLSIVALVFQGAGIGGELVAAYLDSLQAVLYYGFPDNLDTYGVVNGIWNSLFALGAFLGPSLGGILFDTFGFRFASAVVLVCHVIVATLFLVSYCCESNSGRMVLNNNKRSLKTDEERDLVEGLNCTS